LKFVVKEKPWDLAVVSVFTAMLLAAIFLTPDSLIRTILGLPFLLFFPGYVLISFLFPEEEPLDKIERIALSFGLSIAITPLIGLLLNYIWEISLNPILYSLSLFIFTFSFLAYLRRDSIPVEERFQIYLEIERPDWESYDLIDKALVIATVGLLIASGALATHIITTPRTGERFTEFYILGPEGKADDYQTDLAVNETGHVIVGAVNREHAPVNYTLAIGLGYSYENMSYSGDIQGEYVNFTSNNTYYSTDLELSHGQKWEDHLNYSVSNAGDYKLMFMLLRDEKVYRELHLWITVQEG